MTQERQTLLKARNQQVADASLEQNFNRISIGRRRNEAQSLKNPNSKEKGLEELLTQGINSLPPD